MLIAIRRKRNYLSRARPRISFFERRADKRASTNYRRVVGFSRKKKILRVQDEGRGGWVSDGGQEIAWIDHKANFSRC